MSMIDYYWIMFCYYVWPYIGGALFLLFIHKCLQEMYRGQG